jgi:hypothetical protein
MLRGATELTVPALLANPDALRALYGQQYGYGEPTMDMLANYADPYTMALVNNPALLMGQETTDPQAGQLAAIESRMNQSVAPGGRSQMMPFREALSNILSSMPTSTKPTGLTGDPFQPNTLGSEIMAGGMTFDQQPQALNSWLMAAMQPYLTGGLFRTFQNQLQQQSANFMAWKAQNPTLQGTYAKWLQDRLGPTLGL